MKKLEQAEPVRNQQSRMIGQNDFTALVGVLDKLDDRNQAMRIKAMFNNMTKYEALDELLTHGDPDLAVQIAEGVASMDYQQRHGKRG